MEQLVAGGGTGTGNVIDSHGRKESKNRIGPENAKAIMPTDMPIVDQTVTTIIETSIQVAAMIVIIGKDILDVHPVILELLRDLLDMMIEDAVTPKSAHSKIIIVVNECGQADMFTFLSSVHGIIYCLSMNASVQLYDLKFLCP